MNRLAFYARHELRLSWRDFLGMVTAGRPQRARLALGILAVLAAFLHLFAWAVISRHADVAFPPDRETLVVITGSALLAWTVMISQAMESVTRAFYARADLDLLLSSPGPTRLIFMLRIGSIGITTSALALVLIGPFINVLAVAGGPHWLAAYGVVIAMAALATALAVGLTILLFRWVGPRRTRFIAQVVAALIGAAFVIGVQVAAVIAYGTISRFDALHSHAVMQVAPASDSAFWLPARAAMGDLAALAILLAVSGLLFWTAIAVASKRFGEFALAAAGLGLGAVRQRRRARFRAVSPASALRYKEWTLLLRDPWLASQTLMQILYLVPPALLLWRSFGEQTGSVVLIVPVLVMAAGQLAGGLAWLAISGEDAPDLVATAPIGRGAVLRAKVEAVMASVALVIAPLVAALALISPYGAAVTMLGAMAAAASSTVIQLAFRAQAKRSHFRRRQTSSRVATLTEALSSSGWAGTAALLAAGHPIALGAALMTVLVVYGATLLRPKTALA